MTITATPDSLLADFRVGAGRPSHIQTLSRIDRLAIETSLVEALRDYAAGVAETCQHDTPNEYADFVGDLINVHPDDAPTSWENRLSSLLHIYADYIPSSECDYIYCGSGGYHAWSAPDGLIVVDVVSTLTMTELDPDGEAHFVEKVKQDVRCFSDGMFAGVRYIVLDSPYESTWHPVGGDTQPLLFSDINPVMTDGDYTGGEE